MEVIAIKPGFFGKLRYPGDTFEVPAGSKATWFAPSENAMARRAKPKSSNSASLADSAPEDLA